MIVLLHIFYVLFVFIAQIAIGWIAVKSLFLLPKFKEHRFESFQAWLFYPRIYYFLIGLVLQLSSIYFIRSLGFNWNTSVVLTFVPLLLYPESLMAVFDIELPKISFNFVLWFAVSVVLGTTIFDAISGISTTWVNNYGDLAFHLGMISSFTFGDNFPAQYPIYSGESLSYPFFINLWSSLLWWINPSWRSLSVIFAMQWVAIWCVIYFLLNGNRYRLAPWVVLLGGGAIPSMFRVILYLISPETNSHGIAYSHNLIEKGYPFTPFLTTVWIMQRPAAFGLCLLLAAVTIVLRIYKEDIFAIDGRIFQALFAGFLLSLMPLVHTHLMVVGALFCGILLLSQVLSLILQGELNAQFRNRISELLAFCFGFVPAALIFSPMIWQKKGIFHLIRGWMTLGISDASTTTQIIISSTKFWLSNAGIVFLVFSLLFLLTKKTLPIFIIFLLFLFANVFGLAVWEWDQYKLFIGIFALYILYWTLEESPYSYWAHYALCLLIIPALFETALVFYRNENFASFSTEDLRIADGLRRIVPKDGVIAAKPDHNSPVVLSGRKLYFGYVGTLHSHGLDYSSRELINANLENIVNCKSKSGGQKNTCPSYVLWTDREKNFWPGINIYSIPGLKRTSLEFLYQVQN